MKSGSFIPPCRPFDSCMLRLHLPVTGGSSVMAMLMIGELARRTGAKVNTIRFYEDIGLMPLAARTDSGRRTYGEADVRRLQFIRNGLELGFSKEELKSLISLSEQPDRD